MSDGEQRMEVVGGAETVVDAGGMDGPVAVVARKTGERLLVEPPRVARVLRDGRNPERRDAERIEESGFDALHDAAQVTTLVIDLRQHVGPPQRRIVGGVAVLEAVDHQRVEHLRLFVVARELRRIGHGAAVGQRNQQIVEAGIVGRGENPQPRTSGGAGVGRNADGQPVVREGHRLVGQTAVLPQSHRLAGFLRSFHEHFPAVAPLAECPRFGPRSAERGHGESTPPGPRLERGDERPLGRRNDELRPVIGGRNHLQRCGSDRIGLLPLREVIGQQQTVFARLQQGRDDGLRISGSGQIRENPAAAAARQRGGGQQKDETFHRDCISRIIEE